MRKLKVLFIVFLTSSVLYFPSYALDLRFAGGSANYQYEGAGPNSLGIWETKPTYPAEVYLEWEGVRPCRGSICRFRRLELEYLGGRTVREDAQAVLRQVNTWVVYFGWGWRPRPMVGFELGPMLAAQLNELTDTAGAGRLKRNTFRAGTYFRGFYSWRTPGLYWEFSSTIGVLGLPQRQSAISELEIGALHPIADSPWSVGLKIKAGLMQLVRETTRMEPIGSVPSAITLPRQAETDTKILMLNIQRRI